MKNQNFMLLLKYAALTGNVLFVLWVSFNAIDEGFKGTLPEKFSYVGLMGLLAVNSFLILTKAPVQQLKN
ncbi:MAG TPA: hypothetical protein VGI43_14515 [Mucilaginibacter sp.]|jgi:hypothetical protein